MILNALMVFNIKVSVAEALISLIIINKYLPLRN